MPHGEILILTRMTTFIKASSRNQMINIDKYRVAANIIEYHISQNDKNSYA